MNNILSAWKHPKYTIIAASLASAILLAMFTWLALTWRTPTQWLPDAASFKNTSDQDVLFNAPIKSRTSITKYGKATHYTTDVGDVIYELQANPRLKASDCPNITNTESMLPSGCEKLGTFQGQPVYVMHRRMPSGSVEYFVQVDKTFIFVEGGGDGSESLDYLRTFVVVPHSSVKSYLSQNSKHVDAIKARQKAEDEATTKKNAASYMKLDYMPALPAQLPHGWHRGIFTTDGPDADHPRLVSAEYESAANDMFVHLYSGKLSDFTLDGQCGPTYGAFTEYLTCFKPTGADYYESSSYDSATSFTRFLYRPVGDVLVVSEINIQSDPHKQFTYPTELAAIQDSITKSAVQTDKNSLKDSTYSKVFY